MTRLLILVGGLIGAMAITAGAADQTQGKNRARPAKEQQAAAMKELREKYDANKDGKLSKQERAAMSAEDKTKMKESRAARKKAKGKA